MVPVRRPFTPPDLPLETLDWENLLPFLGPAHSAVGRFDALLKILPDTEPLLSPLATNEAVISSRIEGIQTSLENVMQFQAGRKADKARRDDFQEVVNCRKAMDFALDALRSGRMTLSERLLKETHGILMSGVRGVQKSPGQFRKNQVYIAPPGEPIERAVYVPPKAALVRELMRQLERYIHSEERDTLVQLAVVHAQFELIHPFRDGNGRIGRLIMPLFLYAKSVIHTPHFYLSEYFEQHRAEYYGCLQAISDQGRWEKWIRFFLRAVTEQSQASAGTVQAVVDLKQDTLKLVRQATRSQYAPRIVERLCSQPIFTTVGFGDAAEIPDSSTARLLNLLEDAGVIEKVIAGKGRRTSVYAFSRLMGVLAQ